MDEIKISNTSLTLIRLKPCLIRGHLPVHNCTCLIRNHLPVHNCTCLIRSHLPVHNCTCCHCSHLPVHNCTCCHCSQLPVHNCTCCHWFSESQSGLARFFNLFVKDRSSNFYSKAGSKICTMF